MGDEIVKVEPVVALAGAAQWKMATDVAGLVREFVLTPRVGHSVIGDRKFPKVESWMAIANCYGLVAGARDVERVPGGIRAVGEVRRLKDGVVLGQAEGFVGEDEPVWFGGTDAKGKTHQRRAEYAIRAMAQTRAISRACRSVLAFVIPIIDAGLSTTPAEEVPEGGFEAPVANPSPPRQAARPPPAEALSQPAPSRPVGLRAAFGRWSGKTPAELDDSGLAWYTARARESLADPAKERFHAKEQAWLAALETEAAARQGAPR